MDSLEGDLKSIFNVNELDGEINTFLYEDRLSTILSEIKNDNELRELEKEQSRILKKIKQSGKTHLIDENNDMSEDITTDYLLTMYKNALYDGIKIILKGE